MEAAEAEGKDVETLKKIQEILYSTEVSVEITLCFRARRGFSAGRIRGTRQ